METKPLHFEITPNKIAAFEGRKKHDEVFEELLKEILPLDFRDYLGLPDDEHIRQKYIIVAVIKHLLQIAKDKNWNLSKVYDYVYIYNGEFWINCVNGSTCHIPYRENLQLTTYCHIIYELKIIPPAKYESDYEVYLHFRTDQLEKFIKK